MSLNIKRKQMCPFRLCYCVKCSCNISLNQNTTLVFYSTSTTAIYQGHCF